MVGDDEGDVWCSCLDLAGFFAVPEAPREWRRFDLIGCSAGGPLLKYCMRCDAPEKQFGNAELRVLDIQGDTIGAYFLGSVVVARCRPHHAEPALFDVTVDALLHESPHPAAGSVWEDWRTGMPRRTNLWARYSPEERRAWLQVARLHSRWGRRSISDRPAGQTYEIDGRYITDLPGFYCAIGESINGPGGYFGGGPDGLRDCLRGGFGASVPFTLTWRHSDVARDNIAESTLAEILQIFAEMHVAVTLH